MENEGNKKKIIKNYEKKINCYNPTKDKNFFKYKFNILQNFK